MTNAVKTIEELIKNRVWLVNEYFASLDESKLNSERDELCGMLTCLKNINDTEKFYCLQWLENKIEFGYYDESSKWVVIQ